MTRLIKRTLWNLLSLIAGITIISISSILLLELFDSFGIIFLGLILLLIFMLYWTDRIMRDISRFRKIVWFVVINLVLLLIPYYSIICIIGSW